MMLHADSLKSFDRADQHAARQAFGRVQLSVYGRTSGWFFWTYKTEGRGGWDFRDSIAQGWLPNQFDAQRELS
jgi:glucan 1,3-beta-glucosidase